MTKHTNHDTIFGPDTAPDVTYQTIARQVASMQPRALTRESLDDVITIIEFMRTQCLEMHEVNTNKARLLTDKEAELARKEAELQLAGASTTITSGGNGAQEGDLGAHQARARAWPLASTPHGNNQSTP
jgi:hypothetical protein